MGGNTEWVIREAEAGDVPVILEMVRCLAEYEKRPQDATATEKKMRYWLFERRLAEALIAEEAGKAVGYALFYPVFNSFSAEGALHVEDIVIRPECRGRGLGRLLMTEVAALAARRKYDGLDWACLCWNEDAMRFYEGMGATRGLDTAGFSFDEADLQRLTTEKKSREGLP